MSILVTGGLGYIGSHTVVKLLNANYEVIIIDNLSNSKIEVLDSINKLTKKTPVFIEGDIRNKKLLLEIFDSNKIEAVIHFAGLKAVGESVTMPLNYYNNNVVGTIVLLEVMESKHCYNLVFSSSATVYGLNDQVPFKEEYPLSTTNPYGATKRMIEEILQDLAKSNPSFSIALLRYFNPIGAHPSGLIGENPNDIPNNLLPYIAKVATRELECLNVFGNDYETIDGTGVRDFIHVEDLAIGHIKALSYILKNKGIEAFNLGTGRGYSVLQLLHAFENASKKKIPYKIVDRRPGDIGICYASTLKAMTILGWSAELTLEDMCKDAWNFTKIKAGQEEENNDSIK